MVSLCFYDSGGAGEVADNVNTEGDHACLLYVMLQNLRPGKGASKFTWLCKLTLSQPSIAVLTCWQKRC